MEKIKIKSGGIYKTKDGDIVKLVRNSLPYYKFKCVEVNGLPNNCYGEVWTEEGKAYHDDCGYNIVEEVYV